jgi:hypothetical protein
LHGGDKGLTSNALQEEGTRGTQGADGVGATLKEAEAALPHAGSALGVEGYLQLNGALEGVLTGEWRVRVGPLSHRLLVLPRNNGAGCSINATCSNMQRDAGCGVHTEA